MQTNVIHSDTCLNKHSGMFEGSGARSTAADLRKTRVSFAAKLKSDALYLFCDEPCFRLQTPHTLVVKALSHL